MTPTLEKALHIAGAGTVERKEEGGATIFLSTPEYANVATKLAEMYGLSTSPTEVASDHTLHFVETASLDGESIDDEDEDDGDDPENEDDEEDDGDETEETQDVGLNNLDDDGRALRVLSSSESHRFAQKIYQSMLGNDNMGGYAAFLQDFDRFLLTHKGKGDIAFGGKKRNEEASEETVEQRISANFLELMEKAYAVDLPWAVPNADDAIVVAAVEIAKKKQKNGRAGLLSALMKAISGDAGDAAVKAWDDKDSEKLNEVLTDAVKKVSGQAGKE